MDIAEFTEKINNVAYDMSVNLDDTVHIKVDKVRAYGSTLPYLDIIVTEVKYENGILWIK